MKTLNATGGSNCKLRYQSNSVSNRIFFFTSLKPALILIPSFASSIYFLAAKYVHDLSSFQPFNWLYLQILRGNNQFYVGTSFMQNRNRTQYMRQTLLQKIIEIYCLLVWTASLPRSRHLSRQEREKGHRFVYLNLHYLGNVRQYVILIYVLHSRIKGGMREEAKEIQL